MTSFLHLGDCLDVLRDMPADSVDSVVTDPPYGLRFMGKAWDGSVPSVEVWAECLRVLKPGGHLLAFAGTRTQHLMAVAIEDAGFEIRDMIAWAYGSGFPKSRNVGRDVPEFEGWGTALKPALEPIIVARKPLDGTVAKNVLAHGTGALNIDACRIPHASAEDAATAFPGGRVTSHGKGSLAGPGAAQEADRTEFSTERNTDGRWPANLIHDGSDEVLAAFPYSKGQAGAVRGTEPSRTGGPGTSCYGKYSNRPAAEPRGDTGSAARFFYCAKASKADRNDGGNSVRNTHPTVKPTDLMRYLVRLVTPPGGTVLDPFMGTGSTGRGAVMEGLGFLGIDLEPEYVEIACHRIAAAERQVAQEAEAAPVAADKAARQPDLFQEGSA